MTRPATPKKEWYTQMPSNFSAVAFDGSTDEQFEKISKFLPIGGEQKLKELHSTDKIKGLQALIFEKNYIDKDFRSAFSRFYSKRFCITSHVCTRIHMFSKFFGIDQITNENKESIQQNYIGYTIIQPTIPATIGRTFLNPSFFANSSLYVAICDENIMLRGLKLRLSGFPYVQPDRSVLSCAEAAAWMLLRYFSNRYNVYKETYSGRICDLLKNPQSRVVPSEGMVLTQLSEIFLNHGFHPISVKRNSLNSNELYFNHLVYTYIESGFPVILSVGNKPQFTETRIEPQKKETGNNMLDLAEKVQQLESKLEAVQSKVDRLSKEEDGHAIVAIGHTMSETLDPENCDATRAWKNRIDARIQHWMKQAGINFIPSSCFCDKMTLNDPVRSPYTLECFTKYLGSVEGCLIPLPEKVFLKAERAEEIILNILYEASREIKINSGNSVFRLFLTSCRSWKEHILENPTMPPKLRDLFLEMQLPHFIWICQLSELSDYSKKKENVYGTIIIDATSGLRTAMASWMFMQIKEKAFLNKLVKTMGFDGKFPKIEKEIESKADITNFNWLSIANITNFKPYQFFKNNLTEIHKHE